MEGKSIKEKILYWGGITLISTVIIGGSYYIYQSIFGTEEKEKEEKEENENNSLNNSLNDSNQNIQKNNNIEINSFNNINIGETEINNNIINNDNNIENNNIENKEPENINIFNNNIIFLKSFGINIDESKIFNNNNKLTEEGTIRLITYINYLAEKFYILDNSDLEEKRHLLLNKKNNINELLIDEEYLSLCKEALICKQSSYQIAAEKILNNLKIKINFNELDEFLKSIEQKKFEELNIKIFTELNQELFKYDLNIMDINKTKEAYIFYLKLFIENIKKIYEKENNNIEENNTIILQFMTLKMQLDDQLYEKYKIPEDHLKLLVYKYNLLTDNEIIPLQNEFDEINSKFGNIGNIQQ